MRATAQNSGCEPCAEPALSYRFIKRVRRNLDGVLNTIRVPVRHRALAKVHPLLTSTFAVYSPIGWYLWEFIFLPWRSWGARYCFFLFFF